MQDDVAAVAARCRAAGRPVPPALKASLARELEQIDRAIARELLRAGGGAQEAP